MSRRSPRDATARLGNDGDTPLDLATVIKAATSPSVPVGNFIDFELSNNETSVVDVEALAPRKASIEVTSLSRSVSGHESRRSPDGHESRRSPSGHESGRSPDGRSPSGLKSSRTITESKSRRHSGDARRRSPRDAVPPVQESADVTKTTDADSAAFTLLTEKTSTSSRASSGGHPERERSERAPSRAPSRASSGASSGGHSESTKHKSSSHSRSGREKDEEVRRRSVVLSRSASRRTEDAKEVVKDEDVRRRSQVLIQSVPDRVIDESLDGRTSDERISLRRLREEGKLPSASKRMDGRADGASPRPILTKNVPQKTSETRESPSTSASATALLSGTALRSGTVPATDTVLKSYMKAESKRNDTTLKGRDDVCLGKTGSRYVDEKVDDEYYYPNEKRVKVPDGFRLVKTGDGNFIVPRYDEMTDEERQREWASLEIKFKALNSNWKKEGFEFSPLSHDETLTNGEIRYQLSCRYISSVTGCDLYKMMLMGIWVVIEGGMCYMGIPATGYFETQLMIFDIYERKLIEMGQTSGIGKDWSPITTLVVYSLVSMVLVIALNTWAGKDGSSPQTTSTIMRKVASFINGGSAGVKLDVNGVPMPAKDPIADVGTSMGMGDVIGMAKDMGGGDNISSMIGGLMSAFTGGMGGGGGEKKKRSGPRHRA